MNVKIAMAPLPHRVPHANIGNADLRRVTMLFMEDILFLKKQLEQTQKAVIELQGKEG